MEPRIRRAGVTDVADLGRIAQAAYEKYVSRIGRPPEPMVTDYAAIIHTALIHTALVWIAEDQGTAVGFLVTTPMSGYLLIENIAVLPTSQSRGIGRKLLDRAELDAAEADRPEIRLYTNEAMTENLSYYERHGYAETHRATVDGYRRVFFSKSLRR